MMKTWDYKSSLHFGGRHYIRQHLLCIVAGTLNTTLPVIETSQQRKQAQCIPSKSPLPERGLVNHSPGTERAEELPPAAESQYSVLRHACCQMLGELSFFISGAGTMCHCSGKTQIINPWPLGATDGVLRCDGEAVPALQPPSLMKMSRLHRPFHWQLLTALASQATGCAATLSTRVAGSIKPMWRRPSDWTWG